MSTPPQQSTPASASADLPSPQRTAEAKAAFEASLRSVGANYEADLRDRARNLHSNAAALDKQEADLRRATDGLARQNDQLARVADTARDGLKEIGDVQNWAEMIERDLLVVEETVRLAEEREEAVLREEEEDKLRRERGRESMGNGNGVVDGEVGVNGVVHDGHADGGMNGQVKKKQVEEGKKKSWFSWW